jgi:acetylglutamate synthase
MSLNDTKEWFQEHVADLAYIPDDVSAHLVTASASASASATAQPNPERPWEVAEAIVVHALEDAELEEDVVELMRTLADSVHPDRVLLPNVFMIVENVVDLMSTVFQNASLKNAFTYENTFVTIYYVVVFILSCSVCEDRTKSEVIEILKQSEAVCVPLASMASKLLRNNDVYDFVSDSVGTCVTRSRFLC